MQPKHEVSRVRKPFNIIKSKIISNYCRFKRRQDLFPIAQSSVQFQFYNFYKGNRSAPKPFIESYKESEIS